MRFYQSQQRHKGPAESRSFFVDALLDFFAEPLIVQADHLQAGFTIERGLDGLFHSCDVEWLINEIANRNRGSLRVKQAMFVFQRQHRDGPGGEQFAEVIKLVLP